MRIPNRMLKRRNKSATFPRLSYCPDVRASRPLAARLPPPRNSMSGPLTVLTKPYQLPVVAPHDSHLIVIGCKLPSLEQQSMHTRPMGSAVGLHTTGRSRRPQYHSNFRRLTAQTRINHIARIVQRSSHSRYENSLCSHDGDPAASRDIRDCLMLHKIVSKNRIHPITSIAVQSLP